LLQNSFISHWVIGMPVIWPYVLLNSRFTMLHFVTKITRLIMTKRRMCRIGSQKAICPYEKTFQKAMFYITCSELDDQNIKNQSLLNING